MASASLSEYLSIVQVMCALFLMYLMRRYCDRSLFRWHTYLSIYLSYLCAGGMMLLVPLDLAVTIKGRVSETYDAAADEHVVFLPDLRDAYESLFWPSFVLGTFVLAWQEIYAQNGHFTVLSRMIDATRRLLKWWATMAVGGVVFLVILLASGTVDSSSSAVAATIIALTNTYGLAVIVLLLGYGLVELPRALWRRSSPDTRLHLAQQAACVEFKKLSDVQLNASQAAADAVRTQSEVNKTADPELLRCMEVVMEDCPAEFHSGTHGEVARDAKTGEVTVASLAVLRRSLNLAVVAFRTCQGRVERCKAEAFYAEDVLEAEDSDEQVVKWSFGLEPSTRRQWLWHTKGKPLALKALAVVAAFFSMCIMLGELAAIAGPDPDVSIFSLCVHSASTSFRGITTFTCLTLGYTAYATMWSLFQLRIANMMELLDHQQTSPKSLSFNARQVCKLMPPLVFNYLGFMHESGKESAFWPRDSDGNEVNTAFSLFYGELAVLPFIGENYNIYFPILILVFSTCTAFNVFNKVLVAVKLHKFQFGEESITDAQREQGTKLLKREREKMERRAESDQRKLKYQKMKRKSFIQRMFDGNKARTEEESASLAGSMELGAVGGAGGVPAMTRAASGKQLDQPPCLRYMMEKKSPNKLQGWQPRYLVLSPPGKLSYYTGSDSDTPLGVVDLRSLTSVEIYSKGGHSNPRRFHIHVGDRTFKLRTVSAAKAEEWTDALLAWKEYALVHAGDAAIESIHEHDEDGEPGEETHAHLSSPSAAASPGPAAGASMRAQDSFLDDTAPAPISGLLKKRSPSRLKGWQDRFFEVVAPHSLVYYKGNDASHERAGVIDLRLIASVDVYCKEGKSDPKRFNIDLGDRVMKLQTTSATETERWLKALADWQEYALMNDHSRTEVRRGSFSHS